MVITGSSTSRLNELRKYVITSVFADQYISGGNWTIDGVDYPNSPSIEYVVYYIGGIKYIDETLIDGTTTIFTYTPMGTGETVNFIYEPYYKHPDKSKIISQPKINDDVFIIREDLSAFDKNYRLEYITNMVDLTTYAGGRFFNIVNNT